MAIKGQAIIVTYLAWDPLNNVGKINDQGNHTLRRIVDGTAATITAAPAQVDVTNAPGLYSIALTAAEHSGHDMAVGGKSTGTTVIIPRAWTTEKATLAALANAVDSAWSAATSAANFALAAKTAAEAANGKLPPDTATALGKLDAAVGTRAPAATAVSNADLTPARAAKLDNADVATSSRAPAATALSNATWTDARAAKLDNADAAISTRAAAATAVSNATWTDARAAKLDRIGATSVTVSSPVASDGTVEIVAGDEYKAADGTGLSLTVENYAGPSLSGASVKLLLTALATYNAGGVATAELEITGTATLSGSDAIFSFDLTAGQTAALASHSPPADRYNYVYQVTVTPAASDRRHSAALGALTVKGRAG